MSKPAQNVKTTLFLSKTSIKHFIAFKMAILAATSKKEI